VNKRTTFSYGYFDKQCLLLQAIEASRIFGLCAEEKDNKYVDVWHRNKTICKVEVIEQERLKTGMFQRIQYALLWLKDTNFLFTTY
jgi:hypothetical protein